MLILRDIDIGFDIKVFIVIKLYEKVVIIDNSL